MRIKVNVTANDIAKGIPGDGCLCPVARAIQRTKLKDRRVLVGSRRILNFIGVAIAEIPAEARNWIYKFDHGKPIKPFSFTLEVADQ